MEQAHVELILGTLRKERQIRRIETPGRAPALPEGAEGAFRELAGLG